MPNVMGREFPYTPEGMAAAQQYEQAMGMRGGGSMGFRPIGMQGGGVVGYAKGDVVLDKESRAALIEQLMSMTGMRDRTFIEMTNGELIKALQTVEADDLKALESQIGQNYYYPQQAPSDLGQVNPVGPPPMQMQQMQQMPQRQPIPENMGNLGRISDSDAQILQKAMVPTDYYPPETRESNQPYYPELPMMAGGGIMSLRGY